jgi:hypothetical protein
MSHALDYRSPRAGNRPRGIDATFNRDQRISVAMNYQCGNVDCPEFRYA